MSGPVIGQSKAAAEGSLPRARRPVGSRTDARRLDADAVLLGEILAGGLVRTVFQPIVDLDSGGTVGYEALSRGPQGTRLAGPDQLFATARRRGLVRRLDTLCRRSA